MRFVLFTFLSCFLICGCWFKKDLTNAERPSDESEDFTWIAHFDESAILFSLLSGQFSLQTVPGKSAIQCDNCKLSDVKVSVREVPLAEINKSILEKGTIQGNIKQEFSPTDEGQFPPVSFATISGSPVVIAIVKEFSLASIPISEDIIKKKQMLVIIPGDLDLDGFVKQDDYENFLTLLNTNATTFRSWYEGDFNGDGATDELDLDLIQEKLGFGLPFVIKAQLIASCRRKGFLENDCECMVNRLMSSENLRPGHVSILEISFNYLLPEESTPGRQAEQNAIVQSAFQACGQTRRE